MSEAQSIWENHLKTELNDAGYHDIRWLGNTLQGCIYRATQTSTKADVVVKATKKYLHQQSLCSYNNKFRKVQENILSEGNILNHVTSRSDATKSIVKYIDLLESNTNYYLVMEHFGTNLFQFVVEAHQLIQRGQISIDQWHKVVKVIFKQMIESVEHIHKNNVCHLDISLENFVISDVEIAVKEYYSAKDVQSQKLQFNLDSIQVKLIDFGLAKQFDSGNENGVFLTNKYVGKTPYKSPECESKIGRFDGKKNDVWCLVICLFSLIFGNQPWNRATNKDPLFNYIFVENNGNISNALKSWNTYNYINNNTRIVDLFQSVFKFEEQRISLKDIKNHSWLK